MSFGIYVHIPYCLQRCVYCDFATFEVDRIGHAQSQLRIDPPEQYVELLCQEIRQRSDALFLTGTLLGSDRGLDTLYFGGGTPSLIDPSLILTIISELRNSGFHLRPHAEATIEINPATITEAKLEQYLSMGLNRFSVGVQSFNERHLGRMGRKHSAEDSRDTLRLLAKYKTNFNSDLLFALPHQTESELRQDISEMLSFGPAHISPYCLTVPDKNPMAKSRPSDDHQVQMFEVIHDELTRGGLNRYEISNYSLPGKESRHNNLYWKDDPYWGLGLSSHSYLKKGEWGVRFWNPPSFESYKTQVQNPTQDNLLAGIPSGQMEWLELHQSVTDYCHTALRTSEGLNRDQLEKKFPPAISRAIVERLARIEPRLVHASNSGWTLSDEGQVLSNLVFEKVTFLKQDISSLVG
jgi:oxygen-independent coproporphyrinogen-3 oxidase